MDAQKTIENAEVQPHGSGRVQSAFRRMKAAAIDWCGISTNRMIIFLPGILFIAMGVAVLLAPSLFLGLMSGMLLYLGVVLIFLGWKVSHYHERFRDVVKQVETRVYIKGVPAGDMTDSGTRSSDSKKVVIH